MFCTNIYFATLFCWNIFDIFFKGFQENFTWTTPQKLNFEKIFKKCWDREFQLHLKYLWPISLKQCMLEEKVNSVTPNNVAKIRGPYEISFCSKIYCFGKIVKKNRFFRILIFQWTITTKSVTRAAGIFAWSVLLC